MAEPNGNYDWQDRMRRLEETVDRNWQDHERIDRNIQAMRDGIVEQKQNVDKLLGALRDLIDRIPPENLRNQ